MDGINKMKVAELKQALKDRSLPTSGTKAELTKRLAEALGEAVGSSSEPALEDKIDEDELLNEDSTKAPSEAASSEPADATSTVPLPAANGDAPLDQLDAPPILACQTDERNNNYNYDERIISHSGCDELKLEETKSEESSKIAKPDEVAKLSDAERIKKRAEKFGIVSLEDKKAQRAQRFGLPVTGATTTTTSKIGGGGEIDMEKLKKRAERFGSVVSNSLSKADEDERKRKRAERFGVSATTPLKSTNILKSVDSDDVEAKKKKRAERFGVST